MEIIYESRKIIHGLDVCNYHIDACIDILIPRFLSIIDHEVAIDECLGT